LDKRDIIMKHYENPINKEVKSDAGYQKVNSNNISCVDNIDLYVKIEDDIITDIFFDGEACAITISSTSIMVENLIGKSIKEAGYYIKQVESMVDEKVFDKKILNEAIVFEDISKQGNRKTCVLLPYIGMKKIIQKD